MTLHKVTEVYTEWFSACPNITSKFRTIAIYKNLVKENNNSNKTCRFVHDLHCAKLNLSHNKCNGTRVVAKNKILILIFNRPQRSYFFAKMVLLNVLVSSLLEQVWHPP
jgi:hypothetical protein